MSNSLAEAPLPHLPMTVPAELDTAVSSETFTVEQVGKAVAAAIEAHAAGNDPVEAATAVLTT